MSSTNIDPTIVLETGGSSFVYAVAFHPDGKHVLGGTSDGIRRWRLSDGQQVGKQTGMWLQAISVSRDHKWIVCGILGVGTSVWDGELREKVINVEGEIGVDAVDVCPDSSRFATGTRAKEASIWSITTGQRLVGPLEHNVQVNAIQFSPTGDRIATACLGEFIHIFDSHTGDKLITINANIPSRTAITPFAWSSNGQQIFAASHDQKIRAFDASTGTQLAKSQILPDGHNIRSIALAANGKFIVTSADDSILFLDTSTLTRIGPVVEGNERIRSVAISPDSSYLATGRYNGKIDIRDLRNILPDLYGSFDVSTRKEDEQPLTSGDHDGKVSSSTTQQVPEEFSRVKIKGRSREEDDRLEVSSSMPPQFDYDEPLSPASPADTREDEILPIGSSQPILQLSNFPLVTSRPEPHANENLNTVESPRGPSIFRKWLQRKNDRGPASPKPDRHSGKSREPASRQSPSHLSPRVDVTNEGPSWMAAGQRRPRTVATSWTPQEVHSLSSLYPGTHHTLRDKSPVKSTAPNHPNKDAPRSGQGSASANEAGPAQEYNPSQPSAERVHVTRGSGDAIIALRVPSWMVCCRSGAEDGTHG